MSTETAVSADFDTRMESQVLLRPTVCGTKKESDVMKLRNLIACAVMIAGLAVPAFAADIDGQWKATFDTQIGEQHYTYTLKADGEKLTGTAKNDNGSTDITGGTIKGNAVTFVENLNFNGNQIVITYTGTLSGDELKLHRKVGDFAEEDLVAKRVK
jgi:opacity protein-like surface antigen